MSKTVNSHEDVQKVDYDIFARFYDAVMGDRAKVAAKIKALVKRQHPTAKTVLELAAGTGSNLIPLAEDYEVYGLDLSEGMLEIAKTKLPQVTFFQENMVNFELDKKFDVIMCLFDSINHVLKWEDWQKLFLNAREHLNEGGVFIFDVNTPEKLQRLLGDKPNIQQFDGGILVTTVEDAYGDTVNFHEKFFVHQEGDQYKLHEENIREVAFSTTQVQKELEGIFREIEVRPDPIAEGRTAVERVYFSCKK